MEDINKDIKILENLLEEGFEAMCYSETQAIDHLIKAYKELEEEKKICKEELEKIDKVLNLEAGRAAPYRYEIIESLRRGITQLKKIIDNSIPVSLVEEKILNPMKEEHDKAINGFIKRDIPQCIEDGGIAQELGYFIGKIEELLEKRK